MVSIRDYHDYNHKIAYVLHDANSLLGLGDKLVLGLLDLLLSLGAQLVVMGLSISLIVGANLPSVALGAGLDRVERQPALLNIPACTAGELEVGVQGRVPTSQESALNLSVLRKTGLTNTLAGQGVLLERGGQGVLAGAGVLLVQDLRA